LKIRSTKVDAGEILSMNY